MLKVLDDYDWAEVFAYAGDPTDYGYSWEGYDIRKVHPLGEYDLSPFTREDVEHIEGISEGYNDGPPWIVWGKLKDGRWFYVEAGCDYTGWDCQAGGFAKVANSKEEMEQFGITDGAKARFNGADEEEYWGEW